MASPTKRESDHKSDGKAELKDNDVLSAELERRVRAMETGMDQMSEEIAQMKIMLKKINLVISSK